MIEPPKADTANDSDQARINFEDPSFQANSVVAALELMLTTIDWCRHMIQNAKPEKAFSSTDASIRENALSVRDRRALDTELDIFWDDFMRRSQEELGQLSLAKELGITKKNEARGNDMYPWAPETSSTIHGVLLGNIQETVMREHFSKYSTDPFKFEYLLANIRLGPAFVRESVLGSAILPLAVSKMEEFLEALLRTALALHPQMLGELPSIPDEVFSRYRSRISSSDIRRWQIDQKINSLIAGSPGEWRTTVLKRTGIDIAAIGPDWERIEEIVQRRHAIIHNDGMVDENYLAKIAVRLKAGLQLGNRLICSSGYLLPALIELETWALCLASYWAKHFLKAGARYHPLIIGRIVDLESLGRWTHAIAILDALLRDPLPDSLLEGAARVNRWFCLQEIGKGDESLEREIRQWKPEDQTESGIFEDELARAALLRNYGELAKLIRRGLGSPTLRFQKKYMRGMPLMQRAMRESTDITALLLGQEVSRTRGPSGPGQRPKGKNRRR
jgi:hypothetical protein